MVSVNFLRGPIDHFRDIAGFLCSWPHGPHPYSIPIWECSYLTWSPMLGSARAEVLSYNYGREIICEVFQPIRNRGT